MDEQLISNGMTAADEALKTPQPQQESPPSYPSVNAPAYSMGPAQPLSLNAPSLQGYIIQSVPVQQQGCCSGRSEWFKHSIGRITGIVQLVLAIIASILSGITIHMDNHLTFYSLFQGSAISCTVFYFLPAGILGICTKNKSNCVIMAYLVMSVLSAVGAANVTILEIVIARDYHDYCSSYAYYYCSQAERALVPLHSIIAILMIIEFVVAVVASAICCGGLCNCCPEVSPQTSSQPVAQYPSAHTLQAQTGNHVVQGSRLSANP